MTTSERLGRIQALLTETGGEGFPVRPDFQDVVTALRELAAVVADVAQVAPYHGYDRHNQADPHYAPANHEH